MIYLEFPGQDRPCMSYRVYSRMPVRQLYHAIASAILNCEDRAIRIFVDNQVLLHVGTITDRFFPDFPDVPTVFLTYRICTTDGSRNGLAPRFVNGSRGKHSDFSSPGHATIEYGFGWCSV
jgi:hypothetical protein